MTNWLRLHGIQLLIGIALAALPLLYFWYTDVSWKPVNPHEHIIQNGLAYLFFLLFTYFNHTVFVPRWFLNKHYKRYALVAICCVLAASYFPYRIEQWAFFKLPGENTPSAWIKQIFVQEMMLEKPDMGFRHLSAYDQSKHNSSAYTEERPPFAQAWPAQPGHKHRQMPTGLTAKLAILFLLGSVSTLLSVSFLMTKRLGRVENDQLMAELQQLKAQIHPHFLFNTLNCIYSLSIRNDERTPETIVKLAEFMRYIISDAHRDKVPLLTEVNYLANYIDLQKARLQDAVQVTYALEGDGSQLQIAPLILFSFIENAFKYGVDPEEDSLIVIHLDIQDNGLRLHVANNKAQVNQFEKSTGIGLQNSRERLRLLYPNAHQLTIEDTPTHFRINLILTLS